MKKNLRICTWWQQHIAKKVRMGSQKKKQEKLVVQKRETAGGTFSD